VVADAAGRRRIEANNPTQAIRGELLPDMANLALIDE
jgi:hypothetical protein